MKAKTKKTLMWVAAISAVAVVGYVVIKKKSGGTTVAPAPSVAPSGGGAVTGGLRYPVKFISSK